jgi:O-antigen/teichoic acid export membrane protein
MSTIRKDSIKASIWIYIGFAIGALNTYLFTHAKWFTPEEYGLTRAMTEIAMLFFAFSSLGSTSIVSKFFPYYQDKLAPAKNDLLGLAILISAAGFLCVALSIYFFQPVIIKKFSANSALLVNYFHWIVAMAFFILYYFVLEVYAQSQRMGIITNILKEVVLRVLIFGLIVSKINGWISTHSFMILFCLQYSIILLLLGCLLAKEKKLWIQFKLSKVTFRYKRLLIAIMMYTALTMVVSMLRQSIDGIVLAAKMSLGSLAIFGIATYMVSLMQAPLRSMIAITLPTLSQAWKEKNFNEIQRIYHRSSITLFSFSLFVFFIIWINFDSLIIILNLNPSYLQGKWVFFLLSIVAILDMSLGLASQIIATSTYWGFQFWTGFVLTIIIVPLSILFTNQYGILGPAIASLGATIVFNLMRYYFLSKKFHFQPFTIKTLEVIVLILVCYAVIWPMKNVLHGWSLMIVQTIFFSLFFAFLFYIRNISLDFNQLVQKGYEKVFS